MCVFCRTSLELPAHQTSSAFYSTWPWAIHLAVCHSAPRLLFALCRLQLLWLILSLRLYLSQCFPLVLAWNVSQLRPHVILNNSTWLPESPSAAGPELVEVRRVDGHIVCLSFNHFDSDLMKISALLNFITRCLPWVKCYGCVQSSSSNLFFGTSRLISGSVNSNKKKKTHMKCEVELEVVSRTSTLRSWA